EVNVRLLQGHLPVALGEGRLGGAAGGQGHLDGFPDGVAAGDVQHQSGGQQEPPGDERQSWRRHRCNPKVTRNVRGAPAAMWRAGSREGTASRSQWETKLSSVAA